MADKFHVNGKGEAGACKAEKGFCPFGTEADHHGSKNEARDAYEAGQVSSFAPKSPPDQVVAVTTWDYDDAPAVNGNDSGRTADYFGATFRRNQEGKLVVSGSENAVRAYLSDLTVTDEKKLSNLQSIRTLNPSAGSKKRGVTKTRERLLQKWGPEGFTAVGDLPERERQIADVSLNRINSVLRDGDTVVRPYTDLMSYAPSLKGNAGTWVTNSIRFDHENGHFYGVTEIAGAGSFPSMNPVAIVKVVDYGQNFDSAVEGSQQVADKTMNVMVGDSSGKVTYAAPPNRNPQLEDSTLVYDETSNVFVDKRDVIRKELAKAVVEAKRWNELKRQREIMSRDEEDLITRSGF